MLAAMTTIGPTLTVIAGMCAFLLGYAANQGGTCGVAAMRELVNHRRPYILTGFVLASGTAGLICLPLAWSTGLVEHLIGSVPIGAPLLLGATLMGVGAVVNGACLLGSLWRCGNGELRMLALPIGLGIGYRATVLMPSAWLPHAVPAAFARPGLGGMLFVATCMPIFWITWSWLRRMDPPATPGHWPLHRAMALLGVAGAILYVLQPGWSYADLLRRGVAPPMTMLLSGTGGAIAAGLTVLGAVTSARRAGTFRPRRPTARGVARTVGAGILIAIGATLIPGGNDTLLLAAIPAGSLSGATAYLVMNLVVFLLTIYGRRKPIAPAAIS